MHPEPKPDMPMEERERRKGGKEGKRKGGKREKEEKGLGDVRISNYLTYLP